MGGRGGRKIDGTRREGDGRGGKEIGKEKVLFGFFCTGCGGSLYMPKH